jgi:hypothetical protein
MLSMKSVTTLLYASRGGSRRCHDSDDDFVAIAQRAVWGCETTEIIATHFGVEYPERPPR